ncbi:MAG: NMD3-related protein [Nanoarchaeota archaeon]|nr:60S ribosomal export protein NMD3 [Nanoarchaeota archaeon]
MKRFCPVCGKNIDQGTFCDEHKQIEFDFKKITIEVCPCKKYFYRSRWIKYNHVKEAVLKIAEDKIKANVEINDNIKDFKAAPKTKDDGELEVIHKNKIFNVPYKIRIKICPNCSRQKSSYFEAVLQLRSKNQEIINYVDEQIMKKEVFIMKTEELKNGVDIYLSSKKFAMSLGKKLKKIFNGELQITKKLHTFDKQKSKHVHRYSVCFKK